MRRGVELGNIIILVMDGRFAPVVNPVDTSLIQVTIEVVQLFVLQVNTAGTCPPLLLALRLLLQLIC